MKSPVEEQLHSVRQRQRKQALLHFLLYRSIDGEKPELCRYKCMFLGLGVLFLLFSGVLFAQVGIPTIKESKAVEIEIPKEKVAEMPQIELLPLEATVEIKEVDSKAKSEVISTEATVDVSDLQAVNTGEVAQEEQDVVEETTEEIPTPKIPAPVELPEHIDQEPAYPFPDIPPPVTQGTPPVPKEVTVTSPVTTTSTTTPSTTTKEEIIEPEEDIYKGGMLVHQSDLRTEGSLVYTSPRVSNSEVQVYSDSPNAPAVVYKGSSPSSASTVYSSDTNQSPISVYRDGSSSQTSTVYSQSNSISAASATIYDRDQGLIADQTATNNNPTPLTSIDSFASGEKVELPPPSANFKAGDIIPAKLVTGLSVPQGDKSPLVAVSEGNWCNQEECETIRWLGTASYSSGNRVEVTFNKFIVAGVLEEIAAVGLSTDNTPGVLAMIQDTTPTVAQDVLRSAIGGLADYADALANETSAVVSGDIVIKTKETPPLSSFILGGAAETFKLPTGSTAFVRLANISPDSNILVLYGVEQP